MLPFDADVDEKISNVIQSGKINYYLANAKLKEARESGKGKNASDWALHIDTFFKKMYTENSLKDV